MRTIFNNILPPKGYKAITLWPFIFVRKECKGRWDYEDINHEYIHAEQEKELLLVGFYLLYVLEFIVRLSQYRNWHRAYHHISFEREAYHNQHYAGYLAERKHFAWLEYL